MAVVDNKRIAELDPAIEGQTDIVTDIITNPATAAKWAFPIDYVKAAGSSETDLGTKKVPASRLALLDANGKLPAAMKPSTLPNYICGTVGTAYSVPSSIDGPITTITQGSKRGDWTLGYGVISGAGTIAAGHTYLASYNFAVQAQSAGSNLVTMQLAFQQASYPNLIVSNYHVLDESIYGSASDPFPQWISGTLLLTVEYAAQLSFKCAIPANGTAGLTWKITAGEVRVLEVM